MKIIDDQLGEKYARQLERGLKFVSALSKFRESMPSDITEAKEQLKIMIEKEGCFSSNTDLPLPIDPNIKVKEIDYETLRVKYSATKPIVISAKCNDGGNYSILFKTEDLRKDYIVVNIIKLMDMILKREKKDYKILMYRVMPTSTNNGIIEIVPNSETIYSIQQKLDFSILNFIMDNNKDSTVEEIRTNFAKSTAAYCVITYLLGVGDRHLENIMVSKSGLLFHIDYGFILGFDPKLLAPEMRLTPGMIDAIGGEKSIYYALFQNSCIEVFDCLRKHCNLFMNILSLLTDLEPKIGREEGIVFTKERLFDLINNRFLPGRGYNEAQGHLIDKMTTSYERYAPFVHDFLHQIKKEDHITKTVQSIGSGLTNVTISGVTTIKSSITQLGSYLFNRVYTQKEENKNN